jgi:hypothetical protein
VVNPLRHGLRRARGAARRLTRGLGDREDFTQEGLLAERTITPPPRPPASWDAEPQPPDDVTEPLGGAELADLDHRRERRRRSERECA